MSATNDDELGVDLKGAERIRIATAISPAIPIFAYEPANFKKHCEGTIRMGNEVIHAIFDDREFGEALGYKGAKVQNITFDEYIWERFTRDGAQRTKHCMQVQLNAYLYKNSAKFKELYGDAYRKLVSDNNFICVDDISAHCDSCAPLQALKSN